MGLVSPGENSPFCGGTIITSHHILTAAHCTLDSHTENIKDPSSIQVLVGMHETTDSMVDRRDVLTITQHPQFRNGNYDVAILTLTSHITFTSSASPICLPASIHSMYTDQVATVTGWGLTSSDGSASPTLQEVEVIVTSNEKCSDIYPGKIEE